MQCVLSARSFSTNRHTQTSFYFIVSIKNDDRLKYLLNKNTKNPLKKSKIKNLNKSNPFFFLGDLSVCLVLSMKTHITFKRHFYYTRLFL